MKLDRQWLLHNRDSSFETVFTRTILARTIPIILAVTAVCMVVSNGWLAAQNASRPLACEGTSDSGASVGIYSLLYDLEDIMCLAPRGEADGTLVPCLRIGRVYVGQARDATERVLGTPYRDLGISDSGFTTMAYLASGDSGVAHPPYFVIEYEVFNDKQIAFSVQLTGNRPDTVNQFSCLHLEDDEAALRRQLGEPTDISPFEFEEDGVSGVVWSYAPVPISIELVDGKAYSFRVWRPEYVEPNERKLSLLENR